jgi:hypothetical protein
VKEVGQRGKDLGREAAELLAVRQRQAPQEGLALGAHLDQDFPVVHLVAEPAEQPECGHAVDEPPDRVLLELQLPRQRPDGGQAVGREPLEGQEQLVLPGPEALGARGLLAEQEETPDQVAEARQGAVVRLGRGEGGRVHL